MKRVHAIFMLTVFLFVFLVPIVLPTGTVSAQSSYSISGVDYQVEVMYTGQTLIQDTIYVSGQITNGFTIGFPSNYAADVLKVVAFDSNNTYQVTQDVQLGGESGFYGVQVNFNGNTPSQFTVAFIMSNLVTYSQYSNNFTVAFPAYPSLTQTVGNCNVTFILPSTPVGLAIHKSDGDIGQNYYSAKNLVAYSSIGASAVFQVASGTLQLSTLNQLDRTINIDATGKVTASDEYHITNQSPNTMTTFIVDVPTTATNIIIKDPYGENLKTEIAGQVSYGSSNVEAELINATLFTYLGNAQSTTLTAEYNLPSASPQGSTYTLNNFYLYPEFYYYVNHATIVFNPPEGATIVTPKISSLDSSATLTRSSFQDTLTVNRDGISFLDYSVPQSNTVQFSYNYNPVWVSFRPTFWLSGIAVIGCVAAVIVRKRKPGEKATTSKAQKSAPTKSTPTSPQQAKNVEAVAATQHLSLEDMRGFTEAYEEKKELNSELKSLDLRAQKGKIPRRQYKVQRRNIELRIEGLTRTIDRLKESFRTSGASYADIVRQIDSAEEDLAEAEENIRSLESQQKNGEISIETYKENIADYQKQKDKAESTINGILLRLREKTR